MDEGVDLQSNSLQAKVPAPFLPDTPMRMAVKGIDGRNASFDK